VRVGIRKRRQGHAARQKFSMGRTDLTACANITTNAMTQTMTADDADTAKNRDARHSALFPA